MFVRLLIIGLMVVAGAGSVPGLERPDTDFKIFQFPADQIPRIDGAPQVGVWSPRPM